MLTPSSVQCTPHGGASGCSALLKLLSSAYPSSYIVHSLDTKKRHLSILNIVLGLLLIQQILAVQRGVVDRWTRGSRYINKLSTQSVHFQDEDFSAINFLVYV